MQLLSSTKGYFISSKCYPGEKQRGLLRLKKMEEQEQLQYLRRTKCVQDQEHGRNSLGGRERSLNKVWHTVSEQFGTNNDHYSLSQITRVNDNE